MSRSKKLTEKLKWMATVVSLFGAILTSVGLTPLNIIVLNIGSLLFTIWALRIKDKAMITVNAGMLTIYGFGTMLNI
jgi:hypothetical protein